MRPRRAKRRPGPPDEVYFPVVPMLDMAFQLLAFFVLTFHSPSRETRLDLYLPSSPVALPGSGRTAEGFASIRNEDLETSLVVRAEADARGGLKSLRLGEAVMPDSGALETSLRRYTGLLGGEPLRVVLVADDTLSYDAAAKLIGAASAAGAAAIRLAEPSGGTP